MKTVRTKWFASVSLTKLSLVATGMFLATSSALATVRYVNVNNANPKPPYTNWATAATDIQSAVDAAEAGDQIVVTNGTYYNSAIGWEPFPTSVVVDKALVLRSVNGPNVTVINGGMQKCLYLASNAVMVGFTLTNGWGYPGGGGVYCESTNAVLTNCVLTGNHAGSGGGAYGGTLINCKLAGNGADAVGGGACGSTLINCTLTANSADGFYFGLGDNWAPGVGGGAYG